MSGDFLHGKVPPLTVVVSSCEPWPKIAPVLDCLVEQVGRIGAEVIVAVSGRNGLPPEGLAAPYGETACLREMVLEGAQVFQLRAAAFAQARSDIVVLLEDHNLVRTDWCDRILEQFRTHPDCRAVVSAIVNGSQSTLIDQANFLFNFGHHLPELASFGHPRLPTIAGTAFLRRAFPDAPWAIGWLELRGFSSLFDQGGVYFDGANVVTHVQSNGIPRTLANHFHNARSCAGLRRKLPGESKAISRFLISFGLPLYFAGRWLLSSTGRRILNLGYWPTLPYLLLIGCAYGAGSAMGWLWGAGNSPWKLE